MFITGTCEKDEIYKCYDVNYRIPRISLSPSKLFSQYLFSFCNIFKKLRGIKVYRFVQSNRVHTQEFLSQTNTLKIVYLKRKKGNEIPTGGADLLQNETD